MKKRLLAILIVAIMLFGVLPIISNASTNDPYVDDNFDDDSSITTTIEPEEPSSTEPEEPSSTEPEEPSSTEPEEPSSTEPEVPSSTEPEVPSSTEPEVPSSTEPEVPSSTEPEVPSSTEPEVPSSTESEVPSTTPSTPSTSTTPVNPVTIGKNVTGLKIALTSVNSVKITWDKVANATSYMIYRTDGKKVIKYYKSVGSTSFKDTKLSRGKTYSYQVKACAKINGKMQYSNFSSVKKISIFDKKIKSVKASVKKNQITLNIKKVTGAKSYRVVYSTNKKYKKAKTKVFKSNKISIKKLKKGTKYYIKIQAIKKINGKNYCTDYYKVVKTTKK